jgi:hypothetical protein
MSMDRHASLRATLLLTLGAVGCSASSTTSGGDPTVATVSIPTATGTAALPPPDPPPPPTGWITEKNGDTHRASRATCDATIDMRACKGDEDRLFCQTDADCKEHPHGKCVTGFGQIGSYCGCQYSCVRDDDCGPGQACVCRGKGALRAVHSVCAPAECFVDADCPGSTCSVSAYHNGCSEEVRLACHSPEDSCKSDADCQQQGHAGRGLQCVARPAGEDDAKKTRWECAGMSCVIGRPLVIEGEARTARAKGRADWTACVEVDVAALSADERAALAEHHAAVAAMEHASVASFARFTLQLLALGAPAEIIAEAQRAALDEVEHARLAYGIASRFAGRALGPDRLPEATAPLGAEVAQVIEALVAEGCVGETLGAAEGREIARRAGDRGLAEMMERVGADEERHAALAWRSLAWLIKAFGDEARAAAARGFSEAIARHAADPEEAALVREDLGVLSARTLGALRREIIAEVIGPCRAALGV